MHSYSNNKMPSQSALEESYLNSWMVIPMQELTSALESLKYTLSQASGLNKQTAWDTGAGRTEEIRTPILTAYSSSTQTIFCAGYDSKHTVWADKQRLNTLRRLKRTKSKQQADEDRFSLMTSLQKIDSHFNKCIFTDHWGITHMFRKALVTPLNSHVSLHLSGQQAAKQVLTL